MIDVLDRLHAWLRTNPLAWPRVIGAHPPLRRLFPHRQPRFVMLPSMIGAAFAVLMVLALAAGRPRLSAAKAAPAAPAEAEARPG